MENYLSLLKDFLAFKTVSALKEPQEMQSCVSWLRNLLEKGGFQVKVWEQQDSNPVVFASYEPKKGKETLLIYGHYDVQPAEQGDGWSGDPFQLKEDQERLIARGAIDNKGQILIHIAAALKLIKEKKLGYKLKFLIEGDEETGSRGLPAIIKDHKEDLKCEHILISDGDMLGEYPVIEAGFRGVGNATLTYRTANTSVHSGGYGNTIPNAAHELSKLIAKLFNENEEVTVPGFYAGSITTVLQELPVSLEEFKSSIGIKRLFISAQETWHHKSAGLPALVVTGFQSGYTGEGFANIVPDTAEVRFNIRFGQGQIPEQVIAALKTFIEQQTPDYVEHTLSFTNYVKAEKLDTESKFIKSISLLLRHIYLKDPVIKYVGGTLPIISAFRELLGVEPVSIPLANSDSNMHGINENFTLQKVREGLAFSKALLSKSFMGIEKKPV